MQGHEGNAAHVCPAASTTQQVLGLRVLRWSTPSFSTLLPLLVLRTATVDQGIPSAGTASFLIHYCGSKLLCLSEVLLCSMKEGKLTAESFRKETWLSSQNSTKNMTAGGWLLPLQELCLWTPVHRSLGKASRTCPKAKDGVVLHFESVPLKQAIKTVLSMQVCREAGSKERHLHKEAPPSSLEHQLHGGLEASSSRSVSYILSLSLAM